jgi:tetratricopeptide (TPR) repeat protein
MLRFTIATITCFFLLVVGPCSAFDEDQHVSQQQSQEDRQNEIARPRSSTAGTFDLNERGKRTNQANQLCREGRRLRDLKQLAEARAAFENAIALDPNDNSAIVHNDLGLVLESMGDLQGSITEFNKALTFDPTMSSATLNIAESYKQLGQIDLAVTYLKKFVNEHPESPQIESAEASLKTLRHSKPISGNVTTSDYVDSVAPKGVYCWPLQRMPIRLCIEPGSAVDGYRDSFRQVAFRSLREWIAAANHHLTWRLVQDPKEADITISWTSSKADFPHGTEQGITKLLFTRTHAITHADIKICTVPVYAESNEVLSDEAMRLVCLHEIGHALGINGHSPNNNDVMFFCERAFPVTDLSQRDRSTIARLYATEHDEVGKIKGKGGLAIGIPGLFQLKF